MPSNRGSSAPSSISEGLNGIVSAITAAMTAPDAGPYLQLLDGLQKAVIGAVHGGQKGPPQAQKPPNPGGAGMPQGGGTNLNQLQGQAPAGPSAGAAGGPSQSGASADDIRRMAAQQASMAQ